MTKIYKTWIERLESGGVTYGQMRQFCEAVGGWCFVGRPSGKTTNLTRDEADDLLRRLRSSEGLDLVGVARNAGEVRDGKWVSLSWKEFGRRWVARNGGRSGLSADMVAAAAELDFRFVDIARSAGGSFAPVYRAFTPDGRSWRYAPWPWQVKVWG